MLALVSEYVSTGLSGELSRDEGKNPVLLVGFGTSALMSRVNRRDSLRLIGTALDSGIAHFDTARSYGFGEAEVVLGEGLKGRRDQVTITTKVGILPPRRSASLAAAKWLARGLLSVLPSTRAALRQRAGSLVQSGRFDTQAMTESLHTSLRALKTEYVDYLLLHEPDATVLATNAPLHFLQQMKAEGKVHRFGIAAPLEVIRYALLNTPDYTAVLQSPIDIVAMAGEDNEAAIRAPGELFVHSAISRWLPIIRATLTEGASKGALWAQELQLDLAEPAVLLRFALQVSLSQFPQSHLLFTSTRPEHIRANAAALETAASADQLATFQRLMRTGAVTGERT